MQQSADYKELYEQQQLKIELLQAELAQLKRLIFGSKTEQFTSASNPAQLALAIQVGGGDNNSASAAKSSIFLTPPSPTG